MNLYERENQMVLDNKGFEEFAPKIINYTTNFKREESRDKVLVLSSIDTLAQIRRYALARVNIITHTTTYLTNSGLPYTFKSLYKIKYDYDNVKRRIAIITIIIM